MAIESSLCFSRNMRDLPSGGGGDCVRHVVAGERRTRNRLQNPRYHGILKSQTGFRFFFQEKCNIMFSRREHMPPAAWLSTPFSRQTSCPKVGRKYHGAAPTAPVCKNSRRRTAGNNPAALWFGGDDTLLGMVLIYQWQNIR